MRVDERGNGKFCVCLDDHIHDGADRCNKDDDDKQSCPTGFKYDFPQGSWCSNKCPEDKGMQITKKEHDNYCECKPNHIFNGLNGCID